MTPREQDAAGRSPDPGGTSDSSPYLCFGPFRFDPDGGLLFRQNDEVALPPKAAGVLRCLVDARGQVVRKQDLLDEVWGAGTFVTDRSLSEAVGIVRQALGDDAQDPAYVQTVHRRGYRFVAPVSVEQASEGAPAGVADRAPSGRMRARLAGIVQALARWERPFLWTTALLGVVLAAVFTWLSTRPIDDPAVVLPIGIEAADPLYLAAGASTVLSADGTRLALVTGRFGNTRLYLRSLERLEMTSLPGTEGAENPFFSPDGRWIGFFADGWLMKTSVTGGTPIKLCRAGPLSRGGSWGDDGFIVFAPSILGGLARVPEGGGAPEAITTPDPEREGNSHRWPQVLPGSETVLFIGGTSGSFVDADVMALSLETGEIRTVQRGAMYARYLPSGHLLYVHDATLLAVAFDPDGMELLGSPVPVLEGLVSAANNGSAQYSVSDNGTLIYVAGSQVSVENAIYRATREGQLSPLIEEPGHYWTPAISPDGTRLALSIGWPPEQADLWVRHLEKGSMTRLTFDSGGNHFPVWSPDGRWIAYVANAGVGGSFRLRLTPADGSGEFEQLSGDDLSLVPTDWSPDGRSLLVQTAFSNHLGLLQIPEGDLEEGRVEAVDFEPFLASEYEERLGRFSPDGHWIAYESDESGRFEVYVRPRERGEAKWQISIDGGHFPAWSSRGEELYFLEGDRIMAVRYETSGPTFSAGQPQTVVTLDGSPLEAAPSASLARIEIDPGDDSFVVLMSHAGRTPKEDVRPVVVLNWFRELERLVSTGQ